MTIQDAISEYVSDVMAAETVQLERDCLTALVLQRTDQLDRLHVVYSNEFDVSVGQDPWALPVHVPPAVASFWGPGTDDIVSRHALHSLAMSTESRT